MNIILDPDILL